MTPNILQGVWPGVNLFDEISTSDVGYEKLSLSSEILSLFFLLSASTYYYHYDYYFLVFHNRVSWWYFPEVNESHQVSQTLLSFLANL